MRRKRTRTVSVSFDGRGQTTQDFAVGIGIFLLAIAFVFAYLSTLLTPFSSPVGGAESAQADRIAATIVDDLSETDQPNHLNATAFDETYGHQSSADLASELGLQSADDDVAIDRVNVTIRQLAADEDDRDLVTDDDGTTLRAGDQYQNQSAASAGRVVTVYTETDDDVCDPACRLVVRVW
ncbi:hypothetical protein ACFOZ7_20775 [Natribaculum luteum]|uniref:Flagellin n=1 Tax=Natribaculum luteum TaxID=1586232 RepID=A0ABD5P4T9_9EURY|nr:hypothetical protein [Natribaculum luteum]